jgi:CRISPR-associated endoribonuclease Cas6
MKLQFDLDIDPQLHPFNTGELLGRAFYDRVPSYDHHDSLSLHSIGWIRGETDMTRHGLVFSEPSTWSLGVAEKDVLEEFLASVDEDPEILDGIRIGSVTTVKPPTGTATYFAESPILVRDHDEHLTYEEPKTTERLTKITRDKLDAVGIPEEATSQMEVQFADHEDARTKVVQVGDIEFRGNLCPVEVTAPLPELHSLVMSVGMGGLTGMGMGAIIPMSYARG